MAHGDENLALDDFLVSLVVLTSTPMSTPVYATFLQVENSFATKPRGCKKGRLHHLCIACLLLSSLQGDARSLTMLSPACR